MDNERLHEIYQRQWSNDLAPARPRPWDPATRWERQVYDVVSAWQDLRNWTPVSDPGRLPGVSGCFSMAWQCPVCAHPERVDRRAVLHAVDRLRLHQRMEDQLLVHCNQYHPEPERLPLGTARASARLSRVRTRGRTT